MKVKDILTLKELKITKRYSLINKHIIELNQFDYLDLGFTLIKSNVWNEVNIIGKTKRIINDRLKQPKYKLWLIKQRNNLYLRLMNSSQKGVRG